MAPGSHSSSARGTKHPQVSFKISDSANGAPNRVGWGRKDETFTKGRSTTPDHDATTTQSFKSRGSDDLPVPRASHADFPEEARLKTLLRAIAVLDEWLDENAGRTDDEARVRRIEHFREETLEQLGLELDRIRP